MSLYLCHLSSMADGSRCDYIYTGDIKPANCLHTVHISCLFLPLLLQMTLKILSNAFVNNLIKICMFSGCELPFSALQLWYPSETIYCCPNERRWVRGKQNMWSVYRTCQTTTPPATSVREKNAVYKLLCWKFVFRF